MSVELGKAVEETSHAAHNTQHVTQALARMAAELHQLAGQFRYEAALEEVGRLPTAPNGTARAGVARTGAAALRY
jgi:hypothetical protein